MTATATRVAVSRQMACARGGVRLRHRPGRFDGRCRCPGILIGRTGPGTTGLGRLGRCGRLAPLAVRAGRITGRITGRTTERITGRICACSQYAGQRSGERGRTAGTAPSAVNGIGASGRRQGDDGLDAHAQQRGHAPAAISAVMLRT